MVHANESNSKGITQSTMNNTSVPSSDFSFSNIPSSQSENNSFNGSVNEVQASLSSLLANNSSIDPDELVRKLCSIINENYELKETIIQNNLAIKQQFGLLERWNQQIEEQHKQQNQLLKDANKQVASLQQENNLLRSTLANTKEFAAEGHKFKELEEMIQSLNNRLEFNEELLQKAIQEKEDLLEQKLKIEGDLTIVKCSLCSTSEDLKKCQMQREDLLGNVKSLRQSLNNEKDKNIIAAASASKDMIRVGELDLRNLKSLEKDEEAFSKIVQELHLSRNQIQAMGTEVRQAKREMEKYKRQIEEMNPVSGESEPQIKITDPERLKYKEDEALLREEIETLESTLAEERRRSNEDRSTLHRLHNENSKLKNQLFEAREHSDRNEYTDHYYQAKIKSIHEQHDEATAKLVSYEELLGTKNDEISRLKKEIGQVKAQLTEMKSEGDTIAVLRAQVEVYQSDFRAEREAREAIATDREKLRDEVRHLQARNTQMVDELEMYQRDHYTQSRGKTPQGGVEESKAEGNFFSSDFNWDKLSSTSDKKEDESNVKKEENEVDENLLYCPKCNKPFTEIRPLEEHVNRCLDED